LTRPEEEPKEVEGEVAEHKPILLDALKATRKYVCQFDSENNGTACNGDENKLHRLRCSLK
jgi:hypothetical protein